MSLLLALLLAGGAAANDYGAAPGEVEGEAVDPGNAEQVAAMKQQLLADPSVAQALIERIMRSRLVDRFSVETTPEKRRQELAEWIAEDPDAAAQVAVGLASDDAEGSRRYESLLLKNTRSRLVFNPGSRKGVFGRLKKASDESRLMNKEDNKEMAEEEKQELLKTMFEGEGSQGGRVLTMEKDGTAKNPDGVASAASAALADAYYDRLSAGNLRGYSPQLLAMQSALNQRRPPGAPALIETGKLDHLTLSYPGFGMKFDVDNLEKRLRRERLTVLAQLAGRTLSARDFDDLDLEAKLLAQVGVDKLKPRLARRAAVLAKARAALAAFMAKADLARDPNNITRKLLHELGRLQRDGARWIAAAALEEELSRVENEEGFMTAELRAAIEAAPVPPDAKAAYLRRGETYQKRLKALKDNANQALAILDTDAWEAQAAKVEKLVGENALLRRELSRDVADYTKVPFRIAESRVTLARWRVYAEELAIKWVPRTAFARAAAGRRGRLARYRDVFLKIAAGDLARARQALSAAEAN
ncbi:MAG: hypothetical protein SF051_01440 [Elusimicrobiota bacterium]|nr:hypothetical protein [Elusimicrobiota bacterium]